MYHYTQCGLDNVWLANGYRLTETPYGRGVAIEQADDLDRAIALNLVRHKPRLSGKELRFLRQQLDLSQASLAALLGNNAQSVALWEKHGKVPALADKLLRLIYVAHADGNQSIHEAVSQLNFLDRTLNQKIVLTETAQGWSAAQESAVLA